MTSGVERKTADWLDAAAPSNLVPRRSARFCPPSYGTGWNSGAKAAAPRAGGEIVLSKAVYDQMVGGVAGFSSGLMGSKYTIFQDAKYAELLLDPYVDEFHEVTTTFDAIRKAVEKKIVDKTLKVTAITLDAENNQVILAVDAEVDYANLVAGKFASQLYDLTAMGIDDATCTVKVKVYKKSTLAQANWELVYTCDPADPEKTPATQLGEKVKIGKGKAEVTVDVKDKDGKPIDTTSGFYKVEVVQ